MRRRFALAGLLVVSIGVGLVIASGVFTSDVSGRASAVDIGFAQSMSQHHDQAILMSQILLSDGDTELHGVALTIQTAQLLQIGQMRGWLTLWEAPILPSRDDMNWMLAGRSPPDEALLAYLAWCSAAPAGMPGLASSEELNRLRAAHGSERDTAFLQLMIRHHLGGLPMVRFAADNASVDAVRVLAAQMAYHQDAEVQRLMQLLQQRGASPLP